jgi:hypothetical protein
MSILLMVWGFLKRIPWQVWAVLAAGLAFMIWLGVHDHALTKKVTLERDTYWQGREKEANDKYAADLNRKRGEISDLVLKGLADRDALEKKLHDQAMAADVKFNELKNRRSNYVTQTANSRCDLTRGVILQFNSGAARANGAPEPVDSRATDPGADLVDRSAGVSLDTLSAGIESTQKALGKCRNQVIGWQQFWSTVVVPWHDSLARTLKGSP